jgi:hypothetical protein
MGVSVFDDSDQNSTLKPIIDFFFSLCEIVTIFKCRYGDHDIGRFLSNIVVTISAEKFGLFV